MIRMLGLVLMCLPLWGGEGPLKGYFELQGNRGARGLLPENTLPGFRLAFREGMTAIQLDVVLTADDVLIVHNDTMVNPKLCVNSSRKPPQAVPVRTVTAEYMMGLDCGSIRNTAFSRQQVSPGARPISLTRFFNWVGKYEKQYPNRTSPMRFSIRVTLPDGADDKEAAHTVGVLKRVLEKGNWNSRVTIQSFDHDVLAAAGRQLSNTTRAVLFTPGRLKATNAAGRLVEMLAVADRLGAVIISPHYKMMTPELIGAAHKQQIQVIPWSVNVAVTMKKMLAMGVDGLISDYPNRLAKAHAKYQKTKTPE